MKLSFKIITVWERIMRGKEKVQVDFRILEKEGNRDAFVSSVRTFFVGETDSFSFDENTALLPKWFLVPIDFLLDEFDFFLVVDIFQFFGSVKVLSVN
jgi:hypothetical protein